MKKLIQLTNEQRSKIFEYCARQMKVRPIIIEKDFWVCVVLKYLMNESRYKDSLIFKGGTSLSKCYHVIKRFSEDIDLVLKWDILGYSDELVYKTRTKTQNSKFEDEMNRKGSSFIHHELAFDLEENLCKQIPGLSIHFDDNDPMVLYVDYPTAHVDPYINSSIKLEIGPVAAKTPIEHIVVEPYCNEFIDDSFVKDQFKIPVISLERIFFEKLLILYSETNRPIEKHMPLRYFRHFYDVAMISKTDNFQTIITKNKLFEEVRQFKMKYYRNSWSNLEECSLKNILIIPNERRLIELRSDYEKMKDMFFNEAPVFEEVLKQLEILQQTLHKIYQ